MKEKRDHEPMKWLGKNAIYRWMIIINIIITNRFNTIIIDMNGLGYENSFEGESVDEWLHTVLGRSTRADNDQGRSGFRRYKNSFSILWKDRNSSYSTWTFDR